MISFSVIVPVYNKAPHLAACIESVLAQTYENFELILVNDASTDGSGEVMRSFKDSRIRFADRTEPGPGGYAARNIGISMASNPFVAFLDGDDTWSDTFLEQMAGAIGQHPEAGFYSSGWFEDYGDKQNLNAFTAKTRSNNLQVSTITNFLNLFINGMGPVWTSVAVVRKEIIETAGLFPDGRCKFGGDIDTWLRIMLETNKLVTIPEPLASYRMDAVNMVTKSNALVIAESCMMQTIRTINPSAVNPSTNRLLSRFVNHFQFLPVRRRAMAGMLSPSDLKYLQFSVAPAAFIAFGIYSLLPSFVQRFISKSYQGLKG